MIRNRALSKIHRELVFALESARTRLAIAIAAEAKSTALDRWRYYLETADDLRRFTRNLRKSAFCIPPRQDNWIRALNALRQISAEDTAQRLCQVLRDIAAELE